MTPGREDDALSWDGDDDPTLSVGAPAERPEEPDPEPDPEPDLETDAPPARLPEGFTPVGRGSEDYREPSKPPIAGRDAVVGDDDEPAPLGNVELVSLGVIGGFSLLYAVGWLIGGLRLQGTAEFLVAPLAYQVSLWLAVLAPLAWFVTVLLLTRERPVWVRFAWLIGGIVLLVPWPFIMVGAIGQ
ncbi:DNA polymerase III subunit gamma/tau [Microbacterium thalassium]|uniref:DNA polymerase III subunit gamma/tau n=1 Tax=Microbacterium TaxID=33882 RepID=UPI00146C343E|nr:DNA polymerase III subunit gamma/tau [Microbacterium thalassium]